MATAFIAAIAAVVLWGALAFGSVYPWAFVPLAIACAALGLAGLLWQWRGTPRLTGMALALSAITLGTALQIVPLSHTALVRVSPATDAFLSSYDFGYLTAPSGAPGHPVSINPTQTLIGLGLFAALALFLLGTTRVMSQTSAKPFGVIVLATGIALAAFGIIQEGLNTSNRLVLVYGFWQPIYEGSRPFGPFINRNHFAGWMLMALPVALGAWYSDIERLREHTLGGVRNRLVLLTTPIGGRLVLMGFGCALMGLSLLMTRSRSGIGALGVMVLLAGAVLVRRQATWRVRLATIVVFGVLVTSAAAWAGLDVISSKFRQDSTSLDSVGGRIPIWRDTVRILYDFPLAGSGLNTYGTAMMVYQSARREIHFQEAHNDYLQLASEGGLLLGIPILIACGVVVRNVRQRFDEAPKSGSTYWLRVGAVLGMVAIAAQAVFEFSLQMPGNAVLFALLAAMALHQSPSLRRSSRAPAYGR